MKMKFALFALLLACTTLPLRAGDAVTDLTQIELRIKQIELDVALKQYERVETALAEAQLERQLLETGELGEEQFKVKTRKVEEKLSRLVDLKGQIRGEIVLKGKELDDLRRQAREQAGAASNSGEHTGGK